MPGSTENTIPGCANHLADSAVIRRLVAGNPAAMAQPMGKVLPIPSLFDYLAGSFVNLTHLNTGVNLGFGAKLAAFTVS